MIGEKHMKKIYMNENFKHFLHGGDYNPDQWQNYPEVLEEDMRLFKLANCNSMSVGIFAWAALEPEEGKYNFSFLDKAMDDIYANGGRVILATPSGARPAWMAQKYPEVLRVDENRQRNWFGGRHNHCLTSPIYREKVAKINALLAERYDALRNRFFDGEISIARIYTKALTDAEVKAQFSVNPAITPKDASVLFWLDYGDGYAKTEPLCDYYGEDFAHQNLYDEEMDGKFFGYGGDFGDESGSGSFCQNGIVSADRNPQPERYEVKYQYQSVWFDASYSDLLKGNVSVYNENVFTNLSDYVITWELLENGVAIEPAPLKMWM